MTERRRIVAIVLPELYTELASAPLVCPAKLRASGPERSAARRSRRSVAVHHGRRRGDDRGRVPPLGVLLADGRKEGDASRRSAPEAAAVLVAANEAAERFGVRVGHTVAEAHALVSSLVVREVTQEQVESRLGEVAEVALGFGPTVSVEAPDTVWVDVTGAAHLAGGEEALAVELGARARALGHVVRIAVSDGPRLAQALARWGRLKADGSLVVPADEAQRKMAELPVRALPIDGERAAWLVRLGVHTVGELARLPRSATAPRLGDDAGRILDLAEGRDDSPLVAYVPTAIPEEETTWEDPVDGVEPLLFVLRGLVSRLSARLEGRGEAVQALAVVLLHDRAVAKLNGVAESTTLHFDLAAPLWRSEELFRVVSSRLGRVVLSAPTVGFRIEAKAITRALALQLDLSRYASGLGGNAGKGPETLPVVLAELLADIGKDKVGTLRLKGTHRPEKKSRLEPVVPELLAAGLESKRRPRASDVTPREQSPHGRAPTRLLPQPLDFDAPLRAGASVSLEHRLYTVERVTFEQRLDAVEWWTNEPVSRDYVRVWLKGASSGLEALVYVDRAKGVRKVQAFFD